MAFRELLAPFHEGSDGGRSRVQDGHLVVLDDLPESIGLGIVGGTLVDHRRRPVGEGSIDDVAVAGYPADIGGTPVDVGIGLDVEYQVVSGGHLGQIAALGVDDALGPARGPGCVEDVERIFGVERFGITDPRLPVGQVIPPQIATRFHVDVGTGALEHDDMLDARRPGYGQSVLALRGTTLPPRQAPSIVMTTLQLASMMRSARASEEKPPNTAL